MLGLAAVVGLIAANAGKDDGGDSASGPAVAPSGAIGEAALTLPVGAADAPSTLTIWEDFRCPVCAQFETAFRDTITELADDGQIRVEYHLATIIDGNLGGSGSLRAANAAACAQDVGKFAPYHDVLFSNQPPEPDDAFAKNSRLIELAGEVEGLDTPGFRSCVEDGEHDSWVKKSDTAFREGGFQGTPTVLLNGSPSSRARATNRSPGEPEEVGRRGQQGQEAGHRHPGRRVHDPVRPRRRIRCRVHPGRRGLHPGRPSSAAGS